MYQRFVMNITAAKAGLPKAWLRDNIKCTNFSRPSASPFPLAATFEDPTRFVT
jgi:hypothetical protein